MDIQNPNVCHSGMVYPLPIFLNFQTNISKLESFTIRISPSQIFVSRILKFLPGISPGTSYLFELPKTNISKCLILWISQSQIFVSATSLEYPFRRAPAALGALLLLPADLGCHCLICWTLHHCHCDVPLLSRSHRQAPLPPQTRFAHPKLSQPFVHLVDVASLLARRVGCTCQPMWELELAAPVADGAAVGWSE